MSNNTIYDDIFRTMLDKTPALLIPLINEVFHTDYPPDEKIIQAKNEHMTLNGKIITDSSFLLQTTRYHIECQSTPDEQMVLRMLEYDFMIALDEAVSFSRDHYYLPFPRSSVLYLRHTLSTPDTLNVELYFPTGDTILYNVPVIKLQTFEKNDIINKRLWFFLPFYLLKYEKVLTKKEIDHALFQKILSEFQDMLLSFEAEARQRSERYIYVYILNYIRRISNYLLRNNSDIQKEMDSFMGGQIIEIELDHILNDALAKTNAKWEKVLADVQAKADADRAQAIADKERIAADTHAAPFCLC